MLWVCSVIVQQHSIYHLVPLALQYGYKKWTILMRMKSCVLFSECSYIASSILLCLYLYMYLFTYPLRCDVDLQQGRSTTIITKGYGGFLNLLDTKYERKMCFWRLKLRLLQEMIRDNRFFKMENQR